MSSSVSFCAFPGFPKLGGHYVVFVQVVAPAFSRIRDRNVRSCVSTQREPATNARMIPPQFSSERGSDWWWRPEGSTRALTRTVYIVGPDSDFAVYRLFLCFVFFLARAAMLAFQRSGMAMRGRMCSIPARRGLGISAPSFNSSEAKLHRSTELGAVEETQDISTMDNLLRTFRMLFRTPG